MRIWSRGAIGMIALVCTFLKPSHSLSQTPSDSLSLKDAIAEGREHSPRIERAEAAAREAEWSRKEALSGFLPTLSLTAQHFPFKKYQVLDVNLNGTPISFPQIFPTSSATLDASLPIFDGLQNVHRYSAGRLRESAARGDAQWTIFQIEQDIRLRFYQALAAQRLLEVALQNVATIQDHLKQVQNLRRGGVATNYDVLRTEVQVSEALSDRLQAEDNVHLARQRLAVAMGLEADARQLQGDLPDPLPHLANVRALEPGNSFAERTDLRAQQKRVDAAKNNQQAADAYWVPKISLAGQLIYYNNLTNGPTEWSNYRNAYSLGVILKWNLFDGYASVSRAEQAESQWYQAERSHRQALLQAPIEFENWKRRFLSSATVYEARRADIERSQESVRLAHAGFRAGTRTSTEVLDAELELFRARAGVVNALIGCAEAEINLELAVGRRL